MAHSDAARKDRRSAYEFLKVLELMHVRFEDGHCAGPLGGCNVADVVVVVLLLLLFRLRSGGGVIRLDLVVMGGNVIEWRRWLIKANGGIGLVQLAEFGFVVAVVQFHCAVTIGGRMQASGFGRIFGLGRILGGRLACDLDLRLLRRRLGHRFDRHGVGDYMRPGVLSRESKATRAKPPGLVLMQARAGSWFGRLGTVQRRAAG